MCPTLYGLMDYRLLCTWDSSDKNNGLGFHALFQEIFQTHETKSTSPALAGGFFTTSITFTDYTKAFDSVDHKELWKILEGMRIADHLSCLLRNLYAGQEATV